MKRQQHERQTGLVRLLQELNLGRQHGGGLYETRQQFVHQPRDYLQQSVAASAFHSQQYAFGSGSRLLERSLLAATLIVDRFPRGQCDGLAQLLVIQNLRSPRTENSIKKSFYAKSFATKRSSLTICVTMGYVNFSVLLR